MPSNRIKKEFKGILGTWTAPAGVTQVKFTISDYFNLLVAAGGYGGGGSDHAMAMRRNGIPYIWGRGVFGQMGDSTQVSKSVPTIIAAQSFISMSGGGESTVGIKSDGSAWCWGRGTEGQNGDNLYLTRSAPLVVVGSHSFVFVSYGSVDTVHALKADGSVWSWGQNAYGESGAGALGFGGIASPIAMIGGHSFAKIDIGLSFVGLKADGSAWTCGQTTILGDGGTIDKSSPVAVIGGHSFIDIACSQFVGYGLKSNGQVWCWGNNAQGQFGNGTLVSTSSPVLGAIGGHSFISISSNGPNVSALKADGSVWSWGSNAGGELGDGTIVSSSSPVAVIGGHSFIQVANGYKTTHALKADGSIWSWGNGGSMGDNTFVSKSSPVAAVGGLAFQGGSQVILEKIVNVTPGNTYTFSSYTSTIDSQVIRNTTILNSATLTIEYET